MSLFLKIERFVSDSAEIWICGLYVAGKTLMVVTTAGSEHDAYRSGGRNRFTVDELLRPYQASAVHAGMIWQTPLVVYGMGTSEASKNIAEGINCYKQRIEALVKKDIFSDNW